ncbi:hypothetical protein ACW2AB_07230 [Limosilactobacillus fermentum]
MIQQIKARFNDALSEMEGAAVGQVGHDHQVPYVVVQATA